MTQTINLQSLKVGFIGGGNMARAIGLALIKRNILNPKNVWISARTRETLQNWNQLTSENPVNTTLNNADIIINSDIIFLAIKPQSLVLAIEDAKKTSEGRNLMLNNKLFVSVLAGVTLDTLEKEIQLHLGQQLPLKIIRTMPNTPLSIGEGITVYSRNAQVSESDALPLVKMLSQIGIIEEIPENLINSAGGLAGSGPAYAYLMVEGLADGAVKTGLPRALATKFAAQVLVGAGKMVLQTEKHPGQLKDEVCSPGGTTITGMHALETGAVRASLMNAVDAAVRRSKELGA
ncbi:Similar to PYCR2: Pyrroline-5-carboxylate reductase 2 (Bos taurus) [Cotesia congregata]|uniref:pyrroline-5-carboxylate reductase n=1 Tax=Cotesia congregata TaxID=51543 RepID=A0A8J2EAE3_COTCN|nr:Similar to PYCR2: Pyrroline-5-carboxylate reductase 2 (Bos taurus) [Cotesia congregata]